MVQVATKTVLIVEDDAGVARLEQKRLERAGFRAIVAGSADEALDALRAAHVDLMLLDYKLPHGVDGLDFYAQLRATGLDMPVILVTGFGNETLIIKALRIGVRDYISKSLEYLDYLPEAVERVMRQIQLENRLAESEARLTSVINSAKDAILVAEADQRITLFNPAAEQMFCCSAADALGERLSRFFRMDATTSAARPMSGASLTLQVAGWTRGVRATGEDFPLEASISRSEVNGRAYYTLLVRDITERKRAEQQILEQAALLDKATDAIMVRDMEDRILYWNQAAERLYGWSLEEVLGRSARELFSMKSTPEFDAAEAQFREKDEWNGQLRHKTKDGREVVVDSRWTLMRDSTAAPKAKLVINTDITERKKLETQLFRAQRLESLGTLAGGIAHDLNNMLTPIMMAVELLRGAVADPASQQVLATLQASTERGANLVQQILAFARGTPGLRRPLPLDSLIGELSQLLRQTFPKTITIDVDVPGQLWTVEGDATQVHQVLMNLSVNARDAMPEGGRLSIVAENCLIDANSARIHPDARRGPYVVLSVEDTGTGIAPETLDKIFDPFFTTKETGKGTGLGLSTVIGIVRSHQGFITIYSELGRGTQFKVFLPAQTSPSAGGISNRTSRLPTGNGETILLVDDEVSILQIGKTILESHGYQILAAVNGSEAVDLYRRHGEKIRLVLTDMAMPVMDGRALVADLRALGASVPVIVMSGFLPREQADQDLREVRGFLSKPYTAETLLTMVHGVLSADAGIRRHD
jgi:two-component system, cell cycle sensor histidine kinase and response regulator CckA